MRRFCLVPIIVLAVPLLMIFRGRDALFICLNSFAVLFVYMNWKLTITRTTTESRNLESAFEVTGHMVLTDKELARIYRRKVCCLFATPISMACVIAGAISQVWFWLFFGIVCSSPIAAFVFVEDLWNLVVAPSQSGKQKTSPSANVANGCQDSGAAPPALEGPNENEKHVKETWDKRDIV
ncbi:unnamed protein product [Amoebophrya sp. A25]|nr:unnamed protein product [Amoebophrya sp. A25]|eukprot:GSA25T00012045001.1